MYGEFPNVLASHEITCEDKCPCISLHVMEEAKCRQNLIANEVSNLENKSHFYKTTLEIHLTQGREG